MDGAARTLRFDQLEILNEIEEAIAEGLHRIVVQAPTGYGKTIVSAELLRLYLDQGKHVLFVVPSINLVNQSVEVFQSQGLSEIGVMQAYHEMTDWRMPLQVASVQTLSRRTLPKADIVILDEIHVFHKFYGEMDAGYGMARHPIHRSVSHPMDEGAGRMVPAIDHRLDNPGTDRPRHPVAISGLCPRPS